MSKNNQSFISYYNQFKDKIFNYLFYRTGFDRELAEDLTSEVFIKAFKSFNSFDKDKQFQSWIFTITKNHLINHYKADKKNIPIEDVEQTLSILPEDIGQALEIKSIIGIIEKMDSSDKEPLLMRYVSDLTNQEIAQILDKDEGAIRTQISRSLAKLRTLLNS
ncbi:MAG: RNA polymerase sigma factor [Patescibacteria group bacterium]